MQKWLVERWNTKSTDKTEVANQNIDPLSVLSNKNLNGNIKEYNRNKRPRWPQIAHLRDQKDLTSLPTFDPAQSTIKLNLDIINTNILTKFEEDWVQNVAPRV